MNYLNKSFSKPALILLFSCLYISLQAQTEKMIEENDNWKYFHDIAFDYGFYMPVDESNLPSSGTIVSLSGSYFLTDKLGFRSGISYISEPIGCGTYVKIPFLFSARTRTLSDIWIDTGDCESFSCFFGSLLLYMLPKRFEVNIGPAIGYMTSGTEHTYSYKNGKAALVELSKTKPGIVPSLDANLRMSFQVWRIGLNASLGISYLLTKNVTYSAYYSGETTIKPVWFANLGIGGSFRF